MNPIEFPEANKTLLKPETMTDEQCASLPVFTDGVQCVSLWKCSWRERLSILFFGRVWLFMRSGETQPPVAMTGQRDVFLHA